ncbi:MAG: substrate-binding domain-containing protein [Chloroflexi bacterium]|nr:MAG: substrate-binding domain-containing protein [Chloroflexota bacterium]
MSRARAAVGMAAAMIILGACSSPGGGSASASGSGGGGGNCVVGVSWNNFQQPRWGATDKPKMKQTIEAGGGTFIDADANLDNQRQLSDVDSLIQRGAKVLVLLAQDNKAILPALQKAKDAGIPVIAYDRLIEDTSGSVLYITFDNVGVGKAEAEAILQKVPKGHYVLMKGDPGDANASTFLPSGWDQAGLKDKIASGDIQIVGPKEGQFTPGWDTQKAQNEMEAIIDAANASNTKIDAVLAENDSTALGVAQALESKNYGFPPVSGQDGDPANLNNLALGKQYVDVWKNSNQLGIAAGQAALQLCQGKKINEVSINVDPSVAPAAGNSPTDFKTPGGNTVKSLILKPTPLTADQLGKVFAAGWYASKDQICKGVDSSSPGAAACK